MNTVSCEQCEAQLTDMQVSRGNHYCSRRCARLSEWDRKGRPQRIISGGYVLVRVSDHPDPEMNGRWVAEHRYVMAKLLGRPLEPHERVKHKNNDRTDNHEDNLELRRPGHCPGCRCFEATIVRYSAPM